MSVNQTGTASGNLTSFGAQISADGRFVAFDAACPRRRRSAVGSEPPHRHRRVRDWLARHRRWQVAWLSPYASELNPAEQLWTYLKPFSPVYSMS